MADSITVKKWISWEDSQGLDESVGGFGGWFERGRRPAPLARRRGDLHKQLRRVCQSDASQRELQKGGGDG